MKFSPLIKGLITGGVMIGLALVLNEYKDISASTMQKIIFAVYALGIAWAIRVQSKQPDSTGSFKELFSAGFRCFIVVTLCMVIFTFIFIKLHPEFATIEAEHQREELLKLHDKAPSDIETLVSQVKNQYTIRYVSASIFGYLIIGAGFSAVGALLMLLTRRK